MTETENQIENITGNIKLYSLKAISGASFLGGPLAAGYMISENFKALNKPNDGRKSLIIGIVATVILFCGMFILPEKIIVKIPKLLIPLVYTGIIWRIAKWTHGDVLKRHKENNNSFFSGWRTVGIGLISSIIIGIGIFGYTYIESRNPTYEIYKIKIAEFSKNENESLTFYDNIEFKSDTALLFELNSKIIPKWERNIKLINELENIDGLPSDLSDQNKILLKYSELRLEAFLLIKKALSEDTDKYNSQLNILNLKIDNELKKLNQKPAGKNKWL